MYRRKGFTLIELLVVIAIIALLLAILMPALARVKKQAKAVACQANLKQWALVWSMYTDDNNSMFPNRNPWMIDLRSYYKNGELRLCPMATKPFAQGGRQPFASWGPLSKAGSINGAPPWPEPDSSPDNYLSYGSNEWAMNIGADWTGPYQDHFWRTPNVKGAADVPLFMDCSFFSVNPFYYNYPPQYEADVVTDSGAGGEMKRFCVNRHNGVVNGLFLDFSVRTVGLKELWKLKWHRQWPLDEAPPVWPDWMRTFKDYD